MTRFQVWTALLVLVLCGAVPRAQQTAAPRELGIKWVRDSAEYAALTRQVYRSATDALERMAPASPGRPWAVILDVDETALDNSTYQLERAAYGLPYDATSWLAWVRRKEAAPIPGAAEYIAAVRRSGGRVAWITNRETAAKDATRENLQAAQLWTTDDRLCTQNDAMHTKRMRRTEVAAGTGDCAWAGTPMRVVAFVGDQMGDFPSADEQIPDAGTDTAFGRTCFLLPNPMYGSWTTQVTRTGR